MLWYFIRSGWRVHRSNCTLRHVSANVAWRCVPLRCLSFNIIYIDEEGRKFSHLSISPSLETFPLDPSHYKTLSLSLCMLSWCCWRPLLGPSTGCTLRLRITRGRCYQNPPASDRSADLPGHRLVGRHFRRLSLVSSTTGGLSANPNNNKKNVDRLIDSKFIMNLK